MCVEGGQSHHCRSSVLGVDETVPHFAAALVGFRQLFHLYLLLALVVLIAVVLDAREPVRGKLRLDSDVENEAFVGAFVII